MTTVIRYWISYLINNTLHYAVSLVFLVSWQWVPLLIWYKVNLNVQNSTNTSCYNLTLQTKDYLIVLTLTLILLQYLMVVRLMFHPCPRPFSILPLMSPHSLCLNILILIMLWLRIIIFKGVFLVAWCITHQPTIPLHDILLREFIRLLLVNCHPLQFNHGLLKRKAM